MMMMMMRWQGKKRTTSKGRMKLVSISPSFPLYLRRFPSLHLPLENKSSMILARKITLSEVDEEDDDWDEDDEVAGEEEKDIEGNDEDDNENEEADNCKRRRRG